MKIEMQALQQLYEESDKSHTSLLRSSKQSEERIGKLVSENKMLEEKLAILESSQLEDSSVKVKLLLGQKLVFTATLCCSLTSEQQKNVFLICKVRSMELC